MNFSNIEFNNNEPIYMQIVELIKRAIATGELCENEKLPSIREMSKGLKVNPNTMQRAYSQLELIGVTYTKRGMGSFISEVKSDTDLQLEMAIQISKKFLTDMDGIGIEKERAIEILSSEKLQ
ncbi:GntR family transcriptional regulator [uncultured Clostridium sp.]|uniref:GntR family transcriptional regulator n=1 Tax=uncultured Clostridium sp. TaxID=59620 RepID=UPI00260274A8|nr:GntR family transcriptional regulator [uncultured Clostridium sp.]